MRLSQFTAACLGGCSQWLFGCAVCFRPLDDSTGEKGRFGRGQKFPNPQANPAGVWWAFAWKLFDGFQRLGARESSGLPGPCIGRGALS